MQTPLLRRIVLISLLVLYLCLSGCKQASISSSEAKDAWTASAHGDIKSTAFTHWNEEVPPEIPVNCAKCHSTPGYLDYIGADQSTPNKVDNPAPVGTTIECDACHNEVSVSKHAVVMPSNVEVAGLGPEANCMECHQGRASSIQLAEEIAGQPEDEVNTSLKMPNIHANPAAAIFYGSEARGGSEYSGASYESKFSHNNDTCITCHDPHSLQVQVARCSACHLGANTLEGIRSIRLAGTDYDGDGDSKEGLTGEIQTMMDNLLATIKLYAASTPGADPITYNGRFLNQAGEPYITWTPRLLQAAYNYQYVAMDPGGYSHNPKYILQLLYDSIQNLGGTTRGMTRPITDK